MISVSYVRGQDCNKAHMSRAQDQEHDFWIGGVSQVVEHLPSNHNVLSSNPRNTKEKNLFPGRIAQLVEALR
jgi:hypothetical protein